MLLSAFEFECFYEKKGNDMKNLLKICYKALGFVLFAWFAVRLGYAFSLDQGSLNWYIIGNAINVLSWLGLFFSLFIHNKKKNVVLIPIWIVLFVWYSWRLPGNDMGDTIWQTILWESIDLGMWLYSAYSLLLIYKTNIGKDIVHG